MSDKYKKPGEVLENGYTVIENSNRIVLAHKQYNEDEGQYATWKFDAVRGSTWEGNYFRYGPYSNNTREEAYQKAHSNYLER